MKDKDNNPNTAVSQSSSHTTSWSALSAITKIVFILMLITIPIAAILIYMQKIIPGIMAIGVEFLLWAILIPLFFHSFKGFVRTISLVFAFVAVLLIAIPPLILNFGAYHGKIIAQIVFGVLLPGVFLILGIIMTVHGFKTKEENRKVFLVTGIIFILCAIAVSVFVWWLFTKVDFLAIILV